MKVHFLKPNQPNELKSELIELFKSEKQLFIVVAYFNSELFADLIIERHKKKQETFLLLNTSDLIRPQELDSEIVISKALMKVIRVGKEQDYIHIRTFGIKSSNKYQNMHHKFFLNNRKLIFGSLNLTYSALNNNYESVITTNDRSLINKFYSELNELWKSAIELYAGKRDNEIRTLMCPKCEISDYIDFESCGPYCGGCGHHFKIK